MEAKGKLELGIEMIEVDKETGEEKVFKHDPTMPKGERWVEVIE